ncbi:glycoside hydrolase family 78 protein [Aaosphaeria arxii CBS 175.79]|uniref:Glycoside hydrolase family 78 protein n=1 Tax=Aaosphaeria arxii CBS 175.79 TaxID=1450172 RepID=A0A6A5Y7Y0_9PLEO|nr:glycoside hydrolase family 78 protein [Aaosphaeria arxii CBS 175.79]KAF2021682.1 glycoside hydrolase family 78 protein [Aaosphaeria arxii CBS 175.79]
MRISFVALISVLALQPQHTLSRSIIPRDGKGDFFTPIGVAVGNEPTSQVGCVAKFQLTPSSPVATLDYGSEVAGYPVFNVHAVSGKVQIEVKYTEEFRGLNSNYSDGPFTFSIGLSNTYRVETFEVTETGPLQAYLLQGGQRWQSIRLLTSGSITFSSVGFEASIPKSDIDNLPGSFESDDNNLNHIWSLGAKSVAVACLEKGTQKAIWDVGKDGAFVRGMRAGLSDQGAFLKDYTLEFEAKIERAGLGWAIAHPLASPAKGIQLNLVGNLPPETSFINTNTSLTPPNSTWHTIKTSLSNGQYIAVAIDETQIFNVSLKNYYVGGAAIPTNGSFGFGGLPDQSGYFRNVVVSDTVNKTVLYKNALTDPSKVIAEYGVHENYGSVCLDGPKRDRLIWLGDYYHTIRVIGASTSRYDLAKGTLELFLDWQSPSGLLPYNPYMSYDPSTAFDAFNRGGIGAVAGREVWSLILTDYQILGLLSMTDYVRLSGDLDFVRRTWSKWQLQVDWLLNQISPSTGLLALIGGFLGPSNGDSASSCALVQAFHNLADIAEALGDTAAKTKYQTAAVALSDAINKYLWNASLGLYSLSTASIGNYSVNGMAFCITSGTANATQSAQLLSALPSLKLGPGYRDSTLVNVSDPSTNISPNTNGFLLAALLSQRTISAAQTSMELMRSLWLPMLANRETSTGASWEYVNVGGDPGLGLYTSLAHPWGGAPTYLLTEHVAGIQTAKGPSGFGYQNWVVDPFGGIAMGIKRASASVVTAFEGNVEVKWQIDDGGMIDVTIKAPRQTKGVFKLNGAARFLSGSSIYRFREKI